MRRIVIAQLVLFFFESLLITGCKSDSEAATPRGDHVPMAQQPADSSPLFGVGVHTVSNESNQSKVLEVLSGTGLNSVREEMPWKYVETVQGHLEIPSAWDQFVDAANARGLSPICILDYGNKFYDGGDKPRSAAAIAAYVRYAEFVVKHFAGRVKLWEVWNEWDNTTGGFPAGNPTEYAALFDATYRALKQADPATKVLIGAGIQKPQFYEALARLGSVAKADGISVHPYNFDPIFGPESTTDFLIRLEDRMVELSGRNRVDIYVTEFGWPTHQGSGQYSETREAEYAYRSVLLLSSLPYVRGMWWYDLRDDGQNPKDKEDHYGLLHFDWSKKPAWGSYISGVAFAESHRLLLGDQTDLKVGRAVIEAAGSDGSKAKVVWNFHDVKPSFVPRCVPGKGYDLELQPQSSPNAIRSITVLPLNSGRCADSILPVEVVAPQ